MVMTDLSQVDAKASFEPRTAPVTSSGEGRPQRTEGETSSSRPAETAPAGRSDAAYSVDLSNAAQQVSSAPAPQQPEPETSSALPAGGESDLPDSGTPTNQVTSFQAERNGNDTRSTSEASRTLGQVIDTFA